MSPYVFENGIGMGPLLFENKIGSIILWVCENPDQDWNLVVLESPIRTGFEAQAGQDDLDHQIERNKSLPLTTKEARPHASPPT